MSLIVSTEASCPAPDQVDAWVVTSYVRGSVTDAALATHLLECSSCRRQAAMGWALLPDPPYATMQAVPEPDLSFLTR